MSENQSKLKYTKVGAVLRKKDKPGSVIVLGNPSSKSEKYRTHVHLTVTDDAGNKLAESKDGLLVVMDPRKRPGIKEEELEKISDKLLNELFIVEER